MATTLSTQVSTLADESIRPYIEYGAESGTPGANDKSRRVSFEDVKEATKGSIESVVRWLLPNGKLVDNGKEWVALNTARADKKLGSFKVNLRNKPGVWSDFAIGQSGGDLIDLYVYLKGVDKVEAKDAIADYLSVKPSAGSTSLTGNLPATRPRLEKAAAAPSAISAAPTKFPPRTPSDWMVSPSSLSLTTKVRAHPAPKSADTSIAGAAFRFGSRSSRKTRKALSTPIVPPTPVA
jgi:hypothetical protein